MEKRIWDNPEVSEMNLTETQYGGQNVAEFDYVYQNADGNWEGTFVAQES